MGKIWEVGGRMTDRFSIECRKWLPIIIKIHLLQLMEMGESEETLLLLRTLVKRK